MDGMKGDVLYRHLSNILKASKSTSKYYLMADFFSCSFLYWKYTQTHVNRIHDVVNKKSVAAFNGERDYIVLPILTDMNDEKLVNGQINFDDINQAKHGSSIPMRHWMLAIIDMRSKKIEIFNSLHMKTNLDFWSCLVVKWVHEYTNETLPVITFSSKTEHQKYKLDENGTKEYSLTCGLFVCLYFHLHLSGLSLKSIENHYKVTEFYLSSYYINILNKLT